MKSPLLGIALLSLASASGAFADTLLYDNTTVDLGDYVSYSIVNPPYVALGDEIQLTSAGTADQAGVEIYNAGGAGTFDAELDLYDVTADTTDPNYPVGTDIGSFDLTGITSVGGDVLDLTYFLGGLTVPQDLIFTVSVSNQASTDINNPLDLGLDLLVGPQVGSSDPSFIIAANTGPSYFELSTDPTLDENVYFQLSGNPVAEAPELSTQALLGCGLLALGLAFQGFKPSRELCSKPL